MEKNIGLVIFEHLCNQLDIHVLDIDVLLRVSHCYLWKTISGVPGDSCSGP